jgi:hypothetical protein
VKENKEERKKIRIKAMKETSPRFSEELSGDLPEMNTSVSVHHS